MTGPQPRSPEYGRPMLVEPSDGSPPYVVYITSVTEVDGQIHFTGQLEPPSAIAHWAHPEALRYFTHPHRPQEPGDG